MFLLDDHEVLRLGVRALLEEQPDIEVAGEAETASSALTQLAALRPDVAIVDVRLPDGHGVEVCREVRSSLPGTACVILTGYGDDRALFDAIMAGAAGYVSKMAAGAELVRAVRAAAAGQSTLDPFAAQLIMERIRARTAGLDPAATLSGRERRLLELVGAGLTNRQIAERMSLTERTTANYVSSLLGKLGMKRRAQAVGFAARNAK